MTNSLPPSVHYAKFLTSADVAQLSSNLREEFLQEVAKMWRDHSYKRADTMVNFVRESGQFDDAIEGLFDPKPDYIKACEENNIQIIHTNGAFSYIDWNGLDSIDIYSSSDSPIDFTEAMRAIGVDLTQWRYDQATDSAVALGSEGGQRLANQGNFIDSYIAANGGESVNGYDLRDQLTDIAHQTNNQTFSTSVLKDARRILEPYINHDFHPRSQSFPSMFDAAKAAAEDYIVNVDSYSKPVCQCWLVDEPLAKTLREQGENVVTMFDMHVWGRRLTDPSVEYDPAIQNAFINGFPAEMNAFIEKYMPDVAQRIQKKTDKDNANDIEMSM